MGGEKPLSDSDSESSSSSNDSYDLDGHAGPFLPERITTEMRKKGSAQTSLIRMPYKSPHKEVNGASKKI